MSAVVLTNSAGHVLHVRKRGTATFMLPGGKPEPGETPNLTAMREFMEELGVELDPALLHRLGAFRSAAANEAGCDVLAEVFTHPFVPGVAASAEIEEIEWIDPRNPLTAQRSDIAPLNTEWIFSALLSY